MRGAIGFTMAGLGAVLLAQAPQTPAPSAVEGPRFRVAVDAVRIDAVVTDKDGRVVRDLTAGDFELLQDGKQQKVTFAQFVPVAVPPVPRSGTPPLPAAGLAPRRAEREGGAVRREHIQRSIALVVDDLGMSVESLHYVKRALHDYIDRSVQQGDLVALVRTGGSMDGLQPFTTDRRVLHAAVDNLKWNAFSRSGVEAFAPLNQFTELDQHATFAPDDFTALESFRNKAMAAGTLGAINLVIQGARDLPGRKAILFVSEGFAMLEPYKPASTRSPDNPLAIDMKSPDPRVRGPLDRAIDQATRAGVVIYAIDARGLQSAALLASDNLKVPNVGMDGGQSLGALSETVRDKEATRLDFRRDTEEGMAYLAEQTGGFAVLNSNDLAGGLARASQDIRDYYVIGYTPETGTFPGKGKTPEYHKISVRVKRDGLKVRTRREFLGVSDTDESAAPLSPAQQIVNAAISPFTATDIAVRATSLPAYSPSRGLFVRALLHIDASALTFTTGADGRATASADVLGMVFDRDGTEVAHLSTGFSAALTNDAATDALREGLAYTLRVPIPRPGPYQLRFAVRDRESGKVGTAGEFIDLPDVGRGAFALSGIVLRGDADAQGPSAGDDRVVISPSQAVRVYKPGAQLKYAYEIYNAAEPVQVAITVWRGTEKILSAAPNTLEPPPGRSLWFAAGGGFKLGEALTPGRYVLQVAAATTDPGKTGKVHRAMQLMDFEVK